LNFEVFGLAWFAQRQRARNRSRLVSQPSGGAPGSRMFTEPDAPEHQNRLSVARRKGDRICALRWLILQEPEPLSPRSSAVSAEVF
jgi:hypothetical protein